MSAFTRISLFCGILAVPLHGQEVTEGGAVQLFHTWQGASQNDTLGWAILGELDLNGDGIPDLIMGGPRATPFGKVECRSGADGSLLHLLQAGSTETRFGASLAALPDLDGDGAPEFAVGEPKASASGTRLYTGAIRVFSGASGSLLYSVFGPTLYESMGSALTAAADLNGDGVADFLSTSPFASRIQGSVLTGRGKVTAHSGTDGSEIWAAWGPPELTAFGTSVAATGDRNGDGVPDLAVGAPEASSGGLNQAGQVFFHSGADGQLLGQTAGSSAGRRFGTWLAGGGDLDQDGAADLLVDGVVLSGRLGTVLWQLPEAEAGLLRGGAGAWLGDWDDDSLPDFVVTGPAHFANPVPGFSAVVFSGGGGQWLRWDGLEPLLVWGPVGRPPTVAAAGDLDGDGRSELALGTMGDPLIFNRGQVEVVGFLPGLVSSQSSMSVAQGGLVRYSIHFPADAAGDFYQVLGSASGTGPSWVGAVRVPLTVDDLLLRTLLGLYPPFLYSATGWLGANGEGAAGFAAWPGQLPASLAGEVFHLAIVCGPVRGQWRYSSVAKILEFQP